MKTQCYQILLQGHLEDHWFEWFGGVEVKNLENGQALLEGNLPDQTALHGILNKIRDLNLPIISVTKIYPEDN